MAKPVVSSKDVKKSFRQANKWAAKSREIADRGGRKGKAGPSSKNKAQEFVNAYKDEVKKEQGTLPSRSMSSAPSLEHRGMSSTPNVGIGTSPKVGIGTSPKVGIGTSPKVGISTSPKVGISTSFGIGINPNYRAF